MSTSYTRSGRGPHLPARPPNLPAISPLIAVAVLIVALLCLAERKKRQPRQKPEALPVNVTAPEKLYRREENLIEQHQRDHEAMKQRRRNSQTGRELWQ